MSSVVVFLGDGMADENLQELGGKTPLEAVDTPAMDKIAANGISGTFLSLPDGFPTSSDVANMSVLGYDLEKYYPGRGPLEAAARNIQLTENDIAFRCNLVHVADGILKDYSSGHIDDSLAGEVISALKEKFDSDKLTFHSGVSYRNLLILHGDEFSADIRYRKPDSSQGERVTGLLPAAETPDAEFTAAFLRKLMEQSYDFLSAYFKGSELKNYPNMVWPWSPGYKADLPAFSELYGKKAAVITAVDVIAGLAESAGMDVIPVEGATGFIDTNYENKAAAAVKAVKESGYEFVYLHVEAVDECSHMGDLNLKMQAIRDFDSRIVGPVMDGLKDENVTFAVLPDHPVPIKLKKHTRTPVPFAVCGEHFRPDAVSYYSENAALEGKAGHLKQDELMNLLFERRIIS
jgi:2,3-bisphosphoglycerate-independent phosphoglycerate mutase